MSRCNFFAAFFVPDVADGCLEWDWFGSQKNDVAGCCQMLPGFTSRGEGLRAAKGDTSNDGCTKRENSPESRKDDKGKDVAHRKVKERVKLLHELRVSDCSCLCFTTLNQQLDQLHTVHVSRVIAATTGDGET